MSSLPFRKVIVFSMLASALTWIAGAQSEDMISTSEARSIVGAICNAVEPCVKTLGIGEECSSLKLCIGQRAGQTCLKPGGGSCTSENSACDETVCKAACDDILCLDSCNTTCSNPSAVTCATGGTVEEGNCVLDENTPICKAPFSTFNCGTKTVNSGSGC